MSRLGFYRFSTAVSNLKVPVAGFLALFFAVCGKADAQLMTAGRPKPSRQTLLWQGIQRHYLLYVPDNLSTAKPAPLVFILHGGGGNGRRMFAFTGFDKIAQREGIVLVSPDGVDRHWNDGRKGTGYRTHENDIDDVGFIVQLVETVSKEHKIHIDRSRVFTTGISNGGMMSYRLGLERPDVFAAVAPVVASIPSALFEMTWNSARVPLITVVGTGDPLVPYSGGEVTYMKRKLGRVVPVPDAVAFWARRNGIDSKPRVSHVAGSDADGMSVSLTEFRGDSPDQDTMLYTVSGGGHTWPGDRPLVQYLPEHRIGKACRSFDATDAIWNFFQSHPRTSKENQGGK